MAQMEGVGRGDLGAYNAEAYSNLSSFLEQKPLRSNGDAWLTELMQRDEMLGQLFFVLITSIVYSFISKFGILLRFLFEGL